MVNGGQRNTVCFLATFLALFVTSLLPTNAEANLDYPSIVTPPVSWIINDQNYNRASSDLLLKPIIVNGNFSCGFLCKIEDNTCLFAISFYGYPISPSISKVVWSANQSNPVGRGAKLQLSEQGDLTLQDVNNTLVWSTNTAGKSVSGLKLTDQGNLMLFDGNNEMVWKSFDHPTDCLILGQRLVSGQKLVAGMSARNWSGGFYSFSIDTNGYFVASAESDATIVYYKSIKPQLRSQTGQFYAELTSISFGVGLSSGSGVRYIKLGSDGHLKSFGWAEGWEDPYLVEVDDLFKNEVHRCDYPLACGEYGICLAEGCSCPHPDEHGTTYFRQIDSSQPDLGCSPYIPISCESPHQHSLLELKNVSFSGLLRSNNSHKTDINSCKQACLKNCSCKSAAFQRNSSNTSFGWCSFRSEALSFNREENTDYSSSVFLKVQSSPIPQRKRRHNVGVILATTLGATFIVSLISTILLLQIKKDPKDVEEDCLGHISGTPTRFSYEELKVVTNNFSNKLGEGGFSCVFQGTLPGSAQVAVKYLNGFGPVKKSFIAEVETIGIIHHFNLVRLVGFCAQKLRLLLVYEYMSNGSLDQWIFCREKALVLGWQCRRKIILDIAKGLAYLHEGCRQKIIHLDIKPQNILLDENLNAKVSDFGLSKLVGREQSQIVTTMRGTPGYMAPEWLNSVITEKVDVYSFGIVVLEILCGRKNVDRSLPEEDAHLVSLFKRKVEDGELLDLVDKCNEEMQSNAAEVVEMMKVAAWCLQGEYARRPSMSIVVKFLEGKMDNENEYDFSNPPPTTSEAETLRHQMDAAAVAASPLIPSILSGPR